MEKSEIREYFNRLAPGWDDTLRSNDEIIGEILDNACICHGVSVLDVACGTGVMFPYYMERKVSSVCGIDISEEMIKIAGVKFPQKEICLKAIAAEDYKPDRKFDRIMVYNAFPHFINPEGLIAHLSSLLESGGILSVAHSMSRKQLDLHHSGSAVRVSRSLMPAAELEKIFAKYLRVTKSVDDDRMYQLCGIKD